MIIIKGNKYLADCEIRIFANSQTHIKDYHFAFRFNDLSQTRNLMIDELNSYVKTIDSCIVKLYEIKSVVVNIDVYSGNKNNFIYCDNNIFLKYDDNAQSFILINQASYIA